MYYKTATVSKKFRDELKEIYPAAFKSEEYQVFLYWVLFMDSRFFSFLDKRYIAYNFLRDMLFKNDTSFSTIKFLTQFEKDTGLTLNIIEYKYKEECRSVEPLISEEVRALVLAEAGTKAKFKLDRVYFVGGDKFSERKKSIRIKEEHMRHYKEESSIILKYFSEINPASYNPFYQNIDALLEDVQDNSELTEGERNNYVMALNYLSENLAPKYYENSEYGRVFAQGYSLQNLEKTLRKGILKGTLEADLSSAQLTLAAYIWNIPEIKELLEAGVSIWKLIHKKLDISFSELTKACIKDGVYAITFGAGDKTVKEQLIHLTPEQQDAFLNLPFIKALKDAQKQQLKIISDNNGAMSAQKIWIRRVNTPQSVLAKVMQSYERLIIEEVYIIATNFPEDLRILSHEHDGISFCILKDDRKDRKDLVIRRLEEAVRIKGLEIGVPITLELK